MESKTSTACSVNAVARVNCDMVQGAGVTLHSGKKFVAAPVESDTRQQGGLVVAWIAGIATAVSQQLHSAAVTLQVSSRQVVHDAIAFVAAALASVTAREKTLDSAAYFEKSTSLIQSTANFCDTFAAVANRIAMTRVGTGKARLLHGFYVNRFHFVRCGTSATHARSARRLETLRIGRNRKGLGSFRCSKAISR